MSSTPGKQLHLGRTRSAVALAVLLFCGSASLGQPSDEGLEATPGNIGAAPEGISAAPEGIGTAPEGIGTAPERSGTAPAEPGAAPQNAQAAELGPPSRLETEIEFERAARMAEHQQALDLGAQLIELTEDELGRESIATAEAYTDVADVQRQAGRYAEAAQGYLTAVDIYREIDGPFTPLAIDPLTRLGDNYEEAGEYTNAISIYNEARNLSRRNFGLLNLEQIELLDRMSESFTQLSQGDEAEDQQLEALRLVERQVEPGSEAMIDALLKYGSWLDRASRFQEARTIYYRAIREARDAHGSDSPRQVRPLLAFAHSFILQRLPDRQGLSAIEEALEILEMQSSPDPLLMAQALLERGDWHTAFDRTGLGSESQASDYESAWRWLGAVENGSELRREWFRGVHTLIRGDPISQFGLTQDESAPQGAVVVRFDIGRGGQAENVVVVESTPAGLKDASVVRHVSRTRFRPHVVNGELSVARNQALRFTYRYLPEELSGADD